VQINGFTTESGHTLFVKLEFGYLSKTGVKFSGCNKVEELLPLDGI